MGQQASTSLSRSKSKFSLTWILRKKLSTKNTHQVPSPEPPIKFQYSKTRRKNFNLTSKIIDSDKISISKEDQLIKLKDDKVQYLTSDNKLHENDYSARKSGRKSGRKQINRYSNDNCSKIINLSAQKTSCLCNNFHKSADTKSNASSYHENDYIIAKTVGDPKYLIAKENENKNLYTDPSKLIQPKLIAKDNFPLKNRTYSEPTLTSRDNGGHKRQRPRRSRRLSCRNEKGTSNFGYDIEDIDSFLTKACLKKPANIPVVLSYPSMLYQTQYNGYQDEIPLPLGMVVNAVFKKESWLYVQTPHGEEGYVSYSACLPLGIIPQETETTATSPCWETSTDLFPQPCGNMTDSEKITQSEYGGVKVKKSRIQSRSVSVCGERSVDRLYLKAAANSKLSRDISGIGGGGGGKRQTLLVVDTDYPGRRKNTIRVSAGDVVALVSSPAKGWFWIRTRDGSEGFIPASIAGHGYL